MTRLHDAGVDSPRRDALVLLEDTLNKDRAWVVTHPEFEIPDDKLHKVNILINRRIAREPLAYIRGKAWFYGRFFKVNENVMVPRPESESFIRLLEEISPQIIIDVGTGSGCLGITTKLELSGSEVIAIDNSAKALDMAKQNAKKHNVKIQFLYGNLLEPLEKIDCPMQKVTIIANLPYVPKSLITSPEILAEPKEALFSGSDGLDHYRQFFKQIALNSQVANKMDYVMVESLENQHAAMIRLAAKTGFRHVKTDILVQLFEKFKV